MSSVMEILVAPARAEARIRARQAEYDRYIDLSAGLGGSDTVWVDGEAHAMTKVQASHDIQDRMAEAVASAVDLQAAVDDAINDWLEAIRAVERLIEPLDPREYDVLHGVYVAGDPIRVIAEALDISLGSAYAAKKSGIEKLEKRGA